MTPTDRAHYERLGIMRPHPHRTAPRHAERHRDETRGWSTAPMLLSIMAVLTAIAALYTAMEARNLTALLVGGAM